MHRNKQPKLCDFDLKTNCQHSMDPLSPNISSEFSATSIIDSSPSSVIHPPEDFSSFYFSSPHQTSATPAPSLPLPSSSPSSFDAVYDDIPAIGCGGPRRRGSEQRGGDSYYHEGCIREDQNSSQTDYEIRHQVIEHDSYENCNWEREINPHYQNRKHTDINDGEEEKQTQKQEPSSSSSSSSSSTTTTTTTTATRAAEKNKKRILDHICCRCASMFTADCAAVCCCPLALVHLAVLTFIRLPASLAWRLLKRLKPKFCKKRAMTENLEDEASSTKHGSSAEVEQNPAALIQFETQKLWQHFGDGQFDFGGSPLKAE